MNPVNWFEMPARDLDRAKAFYEHLLECSMELHDFGNLKMAWFPSQREGYGATGSLVLADGYTPSHSGTMVYFSVDDIEAALARVEDRGGKIMTRKMSIGEYGFVGHFEDCEGNRVGLHSMS